MTLRTAVGNEVPREIIMVTPSQQWTHARHAYRAGKVIAMRADVEASERVHEVKLPASAVLPRGT